MIDLVLYFMMIIAAVAEPETPPSVSIWIDVKIDCVCHDVCMGINGARGCTPAKMCER